jgi:hypothetical protein
MIQQDQLPKSYTNKPHSGCAYSQVVQGTYRGLIDSSAPIQERRRHLQVSLPTGDMQGCVANLLIHKFHITMHS